SPTSALPPPTSSAASLCSSPRTQQRQSPAVRSPWMAAGPRIEPVGSAMMEKARNLTPLQAVNEIRNNNGGQVALVLQGGGALGAYQCGVYQALHEAGVEPDWIIGTSIGAINAGIIAGNRVEDRLPRLQQFWRRVESSAFWGAFPAWTGVADALSSWT